MKTRDIKQLQAKTQDELLAQLGELRASLASARLEHAQRKLANTTSLRRLKDDIARIKTVIRHKTFTEPEKTERKEEK